ncbi:MAG TPA: hypothetical protein VFZ53_03255 [Polyangiaceae bacterium]
MDPLVEDLQRDAVDEPARTSTVPPTSRRARRARSRSIRIPRGMHHDAPRAFEQAEALEAESDRPHTRSQCVDGPRPCPHVSCRHHLYLDVNPNTGTIKLNFPDLEVWELAFSCALDVADLGGTAIELVSELMNVTRERIRQIEMQALSRLASTADTPLKDFK